MTLVATVCCRLILFKGHGVEGIYLLTRQLTVRNSTLPKQNSILSTTKLQPRITEPTAWQNHLFQKSNMLDINMHLGNMEIMPLTPAPPRMILPARVPRFTHAPSWKYRTRRVPWQCHRRLPPAYEDWREARMWQQYMAAIDPYWDFHCWDAYCPRDPSYSRRRRNYLRPMGDSWWPGYCTLPM
jgi:hypothetical protein